MLTAEHNQEFSFDVDDGCQELILNDAVVDSRQLSSSTTTSLLGLRVLVVDDNPDDCELLALLLAQEGVEVIVTASANEALDCCQRIAIDVLLSDICMPGEDGYSLIQRVRVLPTPSQSQVPAIAISSSLSDIYRERAFIAGFQRYLLKPIDIEELIAAIVQLAASKSLYLQ